MRPSTAVRKRPELSLRSRALQYLARREYSRAELAGKLRPYVATEDDFAPTEDLDALLDNLIASGYLSDERATTQLLHARRPRFGMQRITHEMRQKGIAEELIEQVIPELKDSEYDTALDVWQRKFGSHPIDPHDAKARARQMRFLQSRGFSLNVIFKVLKHPTEDE